MKQIFYLYKAGTLQQKGYSLVFVSKDQKSTYIPIEQIDIIICFSEITLNKRVLSLFNKYKIVLVFFNYYGNYIGRFMPKEYKDGKVLVNQVECYKDDMKRMYIAKALHIGELKNMLNVAKYYNKKHKNVHKQIFLLEECINKIDEIKDVEHLLLLEAKAKQIYYSIFDVVLEYEDFKFIKRYKYPPKNEINALMSYGYALLYSIVLSTIDRSSLYPQISFIHSLSKSNDSLQYDIADIFKPVIVDRLILRLIRKKQITKEHFEYKEDGRCYLNDKGISIFVESFDNLLKQTVKYNGRSYSYRSLITKEVYNLTNYIKGKNNNYKAFVMKW